MRIAAIGLSVLQMPLVRPFETSFGRIDSRELILVDVEDSSGAVGWGECVAERDPFYSADTVASSWQVLEKYLVPAVLGRTFPNAVSMAEAWTRVRGHHMAKAALEMAAWDLDARLQNRPLC